MLTVDTLPDRSAVAGIERGVRWSLPTRVAFRFCLVYFGFSFAFGGLRPLNRLVQWAAAHVFRVTGPLVTQGSGSGDKTIDWVRAFCFLVIATIGTATWSSFAWRSRSHVTLHRWLRLLLRFSLGSALVRYGAQKLFPLQMPAPSLVRLLEPFGQFSPMGGDPAGPERNVRR